MISDLPTDLTSKIVRIVDFSLKVTTNKEWALVMLSEHIDLTVVESLALSCFDDLKASIFHRGPKSDGFVSTATQDVLTLINNCELARVDITLMALQTAHELSVLTIEHPN